MASKRKYGYYIKGNKIAIIEEGTGSGICSLSGYSSQTTCESAGGTWTENAVSTNDGEYRSPVAAVEDGLEIQYAYSPTYTIPDVELYYATGTQSKWFLNGWIVVDGYLTLVRSGQVWSVFGKVDVDDNILVSGSERWNGIHKIQEIQDRADTVYGGIKTYTKVTHADPFLAASSLTWAVDETIAFPSGGVDTHFIDSTTTPYLWIAGSDETDNNGLFSGWSYTKATGKLDFSSGKRYKIGSTAGTDLTTQEIEETPDFDADASEDIYVYKAYREPGLNFITDIDVMDDESFEIDLPRYQANAVVYYLKARMAEDRGDFEQREFFMREFKRQLEKSNSAKQRGPYIIQGLKELR